MIQIATFWDTHTYVINHLQLKITNHNTNLERNILKSKNKITKNCALLSYLT